MDFPIVVIISGRGSNMVNLADAAEAYKIVGVVSNSSEAPGLAAAEQRGIFTAAIPRKNFPTVAAQKQEIFEVVQRLNPKLVALAGYMQRIEPYFIKAFEGRLINIHPALLPKYPGLDTHKRAIEGRELEHGCTVHFVDEDFDTGPIIAQAPVPVLPEDDEHKLSERVLTREHQLYPWVVTQLAQGKIRFTNQRVEFSSDLREQATALDFRLPV